MKNILTKQLVDASYTNGRFDQQKIFAIAKHLTRGQLKSYIKALKRSQASSLVYLFVPFGKIDKYMPALSKLFPKKQIVVQEDTSLLLGIRIKDNDNVYEANLKHTLDVVKSYLEQTYD